MLSKVNSVISNWPRVIVPILFVPEPKNVWLHSSLPFGQGVEIFSAIRMRGKYYSLTDCLDGLCSAGYNQSGDGRGSCLPSFQSRPARRRGYAPTGRTCSVQVGRIEGIRPHYHEYCQSSFPTQSMHALWPLPLPQHSVSFHVWLTGSIYSEVWCWPCRRTQ